MLSGISLIEVERVLCPGGLFHFTDLRLGDQPRENLERQLNSAGLVVVSFEDVTRNVAEARMRVSKTMTRLDRWVLRRSKVLSNHFVGRLAFILTAVQRENPIFDLLQRKVRLAVSV